MRNTPESIEYVKSKVEQYHKCMRKLYNQMSEVNQSLVNYDYKRSYNLAVRESVCVNCLVYLQVNFQAKIALLEKESNEI